VAALDAHRGIVVVARIGVAFLMNLAVAFICRFMCFCCSCTDCLQVVLMGVVASALAALDAHRGVAIIARCGLGFFWNLSSTAENQVTP
jgi:hypothetical protein